MFKKEENDIKLERNTETRKYDSVFKQLFH